MKITEQLDNRTSRCAASLFPFIMDAEEVGIVPEPALIFTTNLATHTTTVAGEPMTQQDVLPKLQELYPNCTFANLHWIGDGQCDYQFGLDVEACGWDGGDCDGVWYPKSNEGSSEKGVGFWSIVVVCSAIFFMMVAYIYAAKRSKSNQAVSPNVIPSEGNVPQDLSKSSQPAEDARRNQILSHLHTHQIKEDEYTNKKENEPNTQEAVQSSDNSGFTDSLPTIILSPWKKNSEAECSICMSTFVGGRNHCLVEARHLQSLLPLGLHSRMAMQYR